MLSIESIVLCKRSTIRLRELVILSKPNVYTTVQGGKFLREGVLPTTAKIYVIRKYVLNASVSAFTLRAYGCDIMRTVIQSLLKVGQRNFSVITFHEDW
jgi:hypothetical protein